MHWDVTAVRPLDGHRIHVELADGRRGIFDLTPYLDHGVFRELKDAAYFARVEIQFGAVTWPHGQDIAPETLMALMTLVDEESAIDRLRAARAGVSLGEARVRDQITDGRR
jgi:hypothetical protein